jgi:23S rRNA pseudouridine1911/1915/1917 synthase
MRLDRALATLVPDMSRSKIQRLVVDGHVMVSGEPASKSSLPVEADQQIVVEVPPAVESEEPRPQALELTILHQDDDLVVIDKPAGLVVHAGAGEHQATLVNGLLHRYGNTLSRCGGAERPGIVHRLDKGTSGTIAIARNDAAHDALAGQFAARTVEKEYAAIVYGCPKEHSGEIDVPLGRDRTDRTKISPHTDRPRDAWTRWEVAEDLTGFAWMSVFPKTGRTHQVRAHLASIHHPCVGDDKYVGAQWKSVPHGAVRTAVRGFARPALHAHRLRLDHPSSGDRVEFVAPFPDDFEALLTALRRR